MFSLDQMMVDSGWETLSANTIFPSARLFQTKTHDTENFSHLHLKNTYVSTNPSSVSISLQIESAA
jgi:hypothetical protein